MKTITEFKDSLLSDQPPADLSEQLKSLWYDGKDDWHRAHTEVDQSVGRASAWVHAYLHRKEGDIWNADYWYTRAGQRRPNVSLTEEWENLVVHFLKEESA